MGETIEFGKLIAKLRAVTAALKDSVGAADNGQPYTRDKDSDTLQEFAALVAEAEELVGVV